MIEVRKKLIEVALPLEAINAASAREKSIRHGHPSTLHLWWARRPLAACRAVLFAQLVDDPSAWPDRFPTEDDQKRERERLHRLIERLHRLIERLVPWEASNDERVLNEARFEIARSIAWGRGEAPPPETDPEAVRRYLLDKAPPVYDPLCGGGSIPLEAQRLGLRAYGSDLNPVAVMISKALVEFPPKFAGLPPVNPEARRKLANGGAWQAKGAHGLAEDVRYYGRWMRDEAEKRIGHLYPKVRVTPELADLKSLVGQELTVIAWLWARTVASPNPACRGAQVPLVSSFMLSIKAGKEAWVEPVIDPAARDSYRFEVRTGKTELATLEKVKKGTKSTRGSNFVCVLTGTPIIPAHIKAEGMAKRMSARLMAIVAEGRRGRIYLEPNDEHERIAASANPSWAPEGDMPKNPRWFSPPDYGMPSYADLFTPRQLVALTTLSDLVLGARANALKDATAAGMNPDPTALAEGGTGAQAYADAVATYLGLGLSRLADACNSLCQWGPAATQSQHLFRRQAIPMVWDFSEPNIFAQAAGDFTVSVRSLCKVIEQSSGSLFSFIFQADAASSFTIETYHCIATDPPYYDNIGHADLADFLYVWLH